MKIKIYICHGDKGGIGKSMLSGMLIDTMLYKGIGGQILLVEGDDRTPDVAPRFADHPTVKTVIAPLNAPKEGVQTVSEALGQAIETAGDTAEGEITIVINTPAGFSGTFDQAAQVFFAELCEMFGAELIVLYSVSPDAHALSQAKLFAKNHKTGGEIIFVLPEFLASAEQWEGIMGAALKSGAGFLFPKCVDKVYNIYRQFNNMPFGDVAPLLMDQPGAMNKVYALQVKTVVNQMRAEIDSALFSD